MDNLTTRIRYSISIHHDRLDRVTHLVLEPVTIDEIALPYLDVFVVRDRPHHASDPDIYLLVAIHPSTPAWKAHMYMCRPSQEGMALDDVLRDALADYRRVALQGAPHQGPSCPAHVWAREVRPPNSSPSRKMTINGPREGLAIHFLVEDVEGLPDADLDVYLNDHEGLNAERPYVDHAVVMPANTNETLEGVTIFFGPDYKSVAYEQIAAMATDIYVTLMRERSCHRA